jgi:site-specific DNA recombinase
MATPPRLTDPVDSSCVLYLRVSSQRQTRTAIDIDADGNSIATQREAAQYKATSLGVPVLREFVEPGVSAQTIEKRPVFQEMITFIHEHPEVRYLIVYARSRAFRNYVDAALTKKMLDKLGVRIISVREDFGEGIQADGMAAMTDIMNDMQNQLSGVDIKIKMRHKAMQGGTLGRAPLGYLNVQREVDGHMINSVAIDEERAPLITQGFKLYATGEYSLSRLATTVADLGLRSRPSKRWPNRTEINQRQWHVMLQEPYYRGLVTYDGQQYQGRHEAIVSVDLFERVQSVLQARSKNSSRDRVHYHYLRGLLLCQRCHGNGHESRLVYTEASGRGGAYQYFVCTGRTNYGCDLPHLPVWQVEESVVDHYRTLEPPDGFVSTLNEAIDEALADEQRAVRALHQAVQTRLAKIDTEEDRLLDLLTDDSLPKTKVRTRLRKLHDERERLTAEQVDTSSQLAIGATALKTALRMIATPHRTYADSPDTARRDINDALFSRIYIDEHGFITDSELKPSFGQLVDAYDSYRNAQGPNAKSPSLAAEAPMRTSDEDSLFFLRDHSQATGSNKNLMVEHRRFELLTSSMPWKRATNCANAPR